MAVVAAEASARLKPSAYPPDFAARVAGRVKRPIGDIFGLRNFGVNLTTLRPGAASALRHVHSRQDELIYVLDGEPTLLTDTGEIRLEPGMAAGFPAGGTAHCLVNRTERDCTFLEIGDRTPGDVGHYPDDDLQAVLGADGRWQFTRKDGIAW
jgi:uncharacterized cupin superfamily protein